MNETLKTFSNNLVLSISRKEIPHPLTYLTILLTLYFKPISFHLSPSFLFFLHYWEKNWPHFRYVILAIYTFNSKRWIRIYSFCNSCINSTVGPTIFRWDFLCSDWKYLALKGQTSFTPLDMQHLVVPGMWSVKIGWTESMPLWGHVLFLAK